MFDSHEVQFVAEPVHVAQGEMHNTQTFKNGCGCMGLGQVSTHELLFRRYLLPLHAVQLLAKLLHVKH
jgi:hypothetical protein